MMKNSEARRFSKRYHTANPPPTGSINKTPKNRYFTNASRHSFCCCLYRFVYVQILSLSKIYAADGLRFFFARGQANFSEIYAVKVRVWRASQ